MSWTSLFVRDVSTVTTVIIWKGYRYTKNLIMLLVKGGSIGTDLREIDGEEIDGED